MLRSISKQSGESVESVLKKKAAVGRICKKGRFEACNERVRGCDGTLSLSINVSSITSAVYDWTRYIRLCAQGPVDNCMHSRSDTFTFAKFI